MADPINLKDVDWNNLSIDNFTSLSETLGANLNKSKKREVVKEFIIVKIDGKSYEITNKDYVRFKTMKSQKSKENFYVFVVKNYQPIIEL